MVNEDEWGHEFKNSLNQAQSEASDDGRGSIFPKYQAVSQIIIVAKRLLMP